jgi:hypothetical protein
MSDRIPKHFSTVCVNNTMTTNKPLIGGQISVNFHTNVWKIQSDFPNTCNTQSLLQICSSMSSSTCFSDAFVRTGCPSHCPTRLTKYRWRFMLLHILQLARRLRLQINRLKLNLSYIKTDRMENQTNRRADFRFKFERGVTYTMAIIRDNIAHSLQGTN